MTELKANSQPYSLEVALASDCASGSDCFVLDVGSDHCGESVPSLKHIIENVDSYLLDAQNLTTAITKLYVVGKWNPNQKSAESSESHVGEQDQDEREVLQDSAWQEQEWYKGCEQIVKLVLQMPLLTELTWISEIPFMGFVLENLPSSLTKLVLNLGRPVRLHQDGDELYNSYIAPHEMRALQQQTELLELRLFQMHYSLQHIIWELVFSNTSEGGMRVLELQMAAAPLVRSEQWRNANEILGPTGEDEGPNENEYKGMEGKGILHYSFGIGEYLDDFCMRKARIASGLDEAKPLPLWYLKLDGFVIDHLPFVHELSRIDLLTCGENCIDAGLQTRPDKNPMREEWDKIVDHTVPYCIVQWPKWTGILGEKDQQRNNRIDSTFAEAGPSVSGNDKSSSPIPLTEESLQMKELDETLRGMSTEKYLPGEPKDLSSLRAQIALGPASNASTRGSEVPKPTATSFVHGVQPIPAIDGSFISNPEESTTPTHVPVKSAPSSISLTSTASSFDQIESLPTDYIPNASTGDFNDAPNA